MTDTTRHLLAADPEGPRRRTDRNLCSHCEATPGGCQGMHWIRGQFCCAACAGDHDGSAA